MTSSLFQREFWGKAVILACALLLFSFPLLAVQALSRDDITLLLIGGASSQKMITMVVERGVNFRMTPELVKKFRKLGASKELIQALEKASMNVFPAEGPAPQAAPSPPEQPRAKAPLSPVDKRVKEAIGGPSRASTPASGSASQSEASAGHPPVLGKESKKTAPPPDLSDPSPAQIQNIIQEFTAKETLFKEARDNYTYHQINKVETLDADGNPDGYWEQDWDILYDNSGNRIEKVTYAPADTLKRVGITEQDIDAMRNIQPFVLTTSELPEYQIKYLGHVVLDKLTTYVFSIRPKVIEKHHQYFDGVVWVDDHDLQIVKTEGRQVPQVISGSNQNLFPRFSTWRQQIDGKFWFPTFTMADDTLYFSTAPVHIKEVIRYTDYKQFRSTSTIKMVGIEKTPNSRKPAQSSSTKDSSQH
jgi:hypothetical protein